MEERRQCIDSTALSERLLEQLCRGPQSDQTFRPTATQLLQVVSDGGLLSKDPQGAYRFTHFTFQEYLAARAIADRGDYIAYTLKRSADSWWREVILMETGILAAQGRQRVMALIKAIILHPKVSAPLNRLSLAAQCLCEVGPPAVCSGQWQQVLEGLREAIDHPRRHLGALERIRRVFKPFTPPDLLDLNHPRTMAAEAYARLKIRTPDPHHPYWQAPFGDPLWVKVPAGECHLRADSPEHGLNLASFWIARAPITHAQYALFIQDSGHRAPVDWIAGQPPSGLEAHPVYAVSWHDAAAYCAWLSRKTGHNISLPSEVQWEKAARGEDLRRYPWGNEWRPNRCNSAELGLGEPLPVGTLPEGVSPYGALDMVGNLFEWTDTQWHKDVPIAEANICGDPQDNGESVGTGTDALRVMCGGAYTCDRFHCTCSNRSAFQADRSLPTVGFRVILSN